MPRTIIAVLVVTVGVALGSTVSAYEPVTHAAITAQAWNRFVLEQQGDILFKLGIFDPTLSLGKSYYDTKQDQYIAKRSVDGDNYDLAKIMSIGLQSAAFQNSGWLMRGAIREDDNTLEGPSKDVDPWHGTAGRFDRVFNHFFDPVHNIPLSPPVIGQSGVEVKYDSDLDGAYHIRTAPNWALASDNAFDVIPGPTNAAKIRGSDAINHFTIFDAREAMWRALTGRRYSDGGSITDDGSPADMGVRTAYWATMFRALGDVMHLNQDMAQPQHTRNEPHSGNFPEYIAGAESWFERFTEARTVPIRKSWRDRKGVIHSITPLRIYDIPESGTTNWTYPIPAFANYSDFWSTALNSVAPGGLGLADFSNHSFFTTANNYGNSNFQYPQSNYSLYHTLNQPVQQPDGTMVQATYLTTALTDFNQADANPAQVRLTRYGSAHTFFSSGPTYLMDDNIYTDMADQLVPRAIAYSAGILNYFFRGKLGVSAPRTGVYGVVDHSSQYSAGTQTDNASTTQGFTKIRAVVQNLSPNLDDDMNGGSLTAVLKFRRNTHFSDNLTGEANNPSINSIDAVRNAVDEVAVSTETYLVAYDGQGVATTTLIDPKVNPVSLPRNSAKEFEFDFGNGVMPLNVTDAYLQIIYRGQLGSGNDADAVVVGTLDISEPHYLNFYNATDYIHMGAHVYTRDQITGPLLSSVTPSDCVDHNAAGDSLDPGCFVAEPVNVTINTVDSSGTRPVVQIDNLPIGQYVQVALLVDSNGATFNLAGDCEGDLGNSSWTINEYQYLQPPPSSYTVLQLNKDHTPTLATMRGIFGSYLVTCTIDGDGTQDSQDDDRQTVMTPVGNVYPFQVQLKW